MFTTKNSFIGLICAIGCINVSLVKAQTYIQMTNSLNFSRNEVVAAGFSWQKRKQINIQKDWENILQKQSQIIANPLPVKVK
jgi:hypothetical protein